MHKAGFGVVAVVVAVAAAMAGADTLFSENFDNTSGTNAALSTIGWTGIDNHGAPATISALQLKANLGWPSGSGNGYLFAYNSGGAGTFPNLAYKTGLDIDLSAYTNLQASWYGDNAGGANLDGTQALAVQIGESWYVEEAGRNLAGTISSGDITSATQAVATLGSTNWFLLTTVATAPDKIGRTGDVLSALPAGNLTGIGIFFEDPLGGPSGAGSQRADSLLLAGDIASVQYTPGDCDRDRDIDFDDLGVLISNYNMGGKTWTDGDFDDEDDTVDFDDLGQLISVYNTSYSAVPEPATMSLLALAGLALIRRK